MLSSSKPLRLAAIFLAISALFHIIAPLVAGFTTMALFLLAVGLVYLVLAKFLLNNIRPLAWLVFFIMLVGAITSIGNFYDNVLGSANWLFAIFILFNLACAFMLFIYLWKDKPAYI